MKERSAECKFKILRDNLICDIILCGLNDNRLRESLLREPESILQKTIQMDMLLRKRIDIRRNFKRKLKGKNCIDSIHEKKFTRNEKKKFGRESFTYDKSLLKGFKFYFYTHKQGKC